jgi:hypothetical protein
MGKKCIPGVICIENVTLAFLVILVGFMVYMYYNLARNASSPHINPQTKIVVLSPPQTGGIATRLDPINDPYSPPLKVNGYYQPTDSSDVRGLPVPGIPINMRTRGLNTNYNQIGILTRPGGNNDNMILPLMGRRNISGRDKWQYYTMSNSAGNINTKLPVSVNGKNCSAEYGCDEINNNDTVYVEGYKDTFSATIYESGTFSYIPYL